MSPSSVPPPPPSIDLAPIGNCAVSALIDRHGRHVWACAPRQERIRKWRALMQVMRDTDVGLWRDTYVTALRAAPVADAPLKGEGRADAA